MIRAIAMAAPVLAVLACGGAGTSVGGDAAPIEAGGDVAGTVPTSCELATQAGCAADQQCSPFCESQQLVIACRAEPAAAPAIGAACMNIPCTRGSACMAVTGMSATCKKLCTASTDCDAGQACRDVTVSYTCGVTAAKAILIKACL
jgi:hypothetical protein